MPENFNALDIVNGAKTFSKGNCAWVTNTAGKKSNADSKSKKKSVCLLLDVRQYNAIQKLAIQESKQNGKTRTMSTIIQDALRKSFPFLEQKDMFGEMR